MAPVRVSKIIAVCLVCAVIAACKPQYRERPYGFLKLGKINELASVAAEHELPLDALFLRRDAQGLSVMSLLCTWDLSPLRREGSRWVSENGSAYSLDGTLLNGPATRGLPYYEIILDRGEYDGKFDTLYAKIGNEKPRDWRFALGAK